MHSRSRLLGHTFALLVTIVWGTTFISTKLLLRAYDPLAIMTYRFVIAWVILFFLHPKPLLPKSLREELPFMAAGLTGLTLYFILENTALAYTLASTVGIIISAAPMFSALMLWLCRRAPRPRWSFFAGFVLALTGITLISLARGETLDLNPLGSLLTLGAAFCWGCYGVCVELTRSSGCTNLQVTRKVFFWGLVFTAPLLALLRPDLSLAHLAAPDLLFNVLYLGVGASAICFVLWNKALSLLGSVSTNVYLYLTPVVTLFASALILHEPVTLQALAAIALILAGLWLSQRKTGALSEEASASPSST